MKDRTLIDAFTAVGYESPQFCYCFLILSGSFKKQILCSLLVCYQVVGGQSERWMKSRDLVLNYAFS